MSTKKMKVAFIGLGVMGYPMASHLSKAGFETKVYNRTVERAKVWADTFDGQYGETPAQTANSMDVVAICVGNDSDVKSVVFGNDGVLASMKPGAILVDHTTTSADLAKELASVCAEKGVHFIDAPISGGQAGAENGQLTIMCGGELETFERVSPIFSTYGHNFTLMGPHGQGQRCKMVNQICIAGVLKGLCEALVLAEKSELNTDQVVDVLKHGAAGSWQMENRAITMSQQKFDFGFAIDWMRKDLGICLEEAKKHNLTLPLVETVDREYSQLQAQGYGRMDTSVLIKTYK